MSDYADTYEQEQEPTGARTSLRHLTTDDAEEAAENEEEE